MYWAGLKDVVWGLVSLSALTQGSVWNANPLQMGSHTKVPCAQAEDSGLLGPLQSPNWVKLCLVSTVFFTPVSIVLRVEKCLGLSVGDRVPIQNCLSAMAVFTYTYTVKCKIASLLWPPALILYSVSARGHSRQAILYWIPAFPGIQWSVSVPDSSEQYLALPGTLTLHWLPGKARIQYNVACLLRPSAFTVLLTIARHTYTAVSST